MERLAAQNAGHRESHLALAAAAVDAELWATARKHFDEAEEAGRRDGRLCRLRADAEEAEHGDTEAARRWLVAAAEAEPDPAWVCGDCGAVWRHWTPVCGRCESFASLAGGRRNMSVRARRRRPRPRAARKWWMPLRRPRSPPETPPSPRRARPGTDRAAPVSIWTVRSIYASTAQPPP